MSTDSEITKMSKIFSKFYKFLQVITGIDFGFLLFKSSKINVAAKSLFITQAVCLSIACSIQTFLDESPATFFRHSLFVLCNLLNLLFFATMDRDATVAGCQSVFRNVDMKLSINIHSHYFEIKHFIAISLYIALRFILTYITCVVNKLCLTGYVKNVYFYWLFVSRYVVIVQTVFIFYSTKCRLKKLVQALKRENDSIETYYRCYKMISDISFKLKRAYEPVIVVNLILKIIEIWAFIYIGVAHMKDEGVSTWKIFLGPGQLATTDFFIASFVSPIFAGMLHSQAERVRHILHDKAFDCHDELRSRELSKFIRYVEAHPMKFKAFKVIPLDATLPGMVLSFCVTYLIVILQFSHLV